MEQIYNILKEIGNNLDYNTIATVIASLSLATSAISLYSTFKGKEANNLKLNKLEIKSGGVY